MKSLPVCWTYIFNSSHLKSKRNQNWWTRKSFLAFLLESIELFLLPISKIMIQYQKISTSYINWSITGRSLLDCNLCHYFTKHSIQKKSWVIDFIMLSIGRVTFHWGCMITLQHHHTFTAMYKCWPWKVWYSDQNWSQKENAIQCFWIWFIELFQMTNIQADKKHL